MRLLVDTNRLTDFFRTEPGVVDTLERAAEIYLSFITLAEIKSGFRAGSRRLENERLLRSLLSQTDIKVLFPDFETTEVYAQLMAGLRKAGTPIPTNDLWIASLAVQHNLGLFTRDAHFKRLPQLVLVSL